MFCLLLPALLSPDLAAPAVRGQYVEARTCDVFTGSCFANADTGLTGKNAVLAWKVTSGTVSGTRLDGLGVVAVVAVRSAKVDLTICNCDGDGCATLTAGAVKIQTRCLDAHHDRACGNESTIYPPLAKGVSAKAAMATEHSFKGPGLNETWTDHDRRGAFVGSFATR